MAGKEELSDDYVANLLSEDAKDRSIKYSSLGMDAFLSPSKAPANKPKPNMRFLRNIIRDTDNHNAALLRKEAAESRARLVDLETKDAKSAQDTRRRQLGQITALLRGASKKGQKTRFSENSRRQRRNTSSEEDEVDEVDPERKKWAEERLRQNRDSVSVRDKSEKSSESARKEHKRHGSPSEEVTKDGEKKEKRSRRRSQSHSRSRSPREHKSRSKESRHRHRSRSPKRHRSKRDKVSEEEIADGEEEEDKERGHKKKHHREVEDKATDRNHRRKHRRDADEDEEPDRKHKKNHRQEPEEGQETERKHKRKHRQELDEDQETERKHKKKHGKSQSSNEEDEVAESKTKSHKSKHKSQRKAKSHDADSDSDPLTSFLGPLPPRNLDSDQPAIPRPRGRGAISSTSGKTSMDRRFSASYDPSEDVGFDDPDDSVSTKNNKKKTLSAAESKEEEDWDLALEAIRDRQRWRAKGADRLLAAGFTEEEIGKYGRNSAAKEKGEEDVRWAKKGEEKEWDRGKALVDDDGDSPLSMAEESSWGRLKGT